MGVIEKAHPGGKDRLHREWNFSVEGAELLLKRYGTFCGWNRITLERGSREVYEIVLQGETRQEFFFGEHFRQYQGNRFSFVEYIDIAAQKGTLPNREEIASHAVEPDIAEAYERYASRIISREPQNTKV